MHDCWNGTWYFGLVDELWRADEHRRSGWALATSGDVYNAIRALRKSLADALDLVPPNPDDYHAPDEPYANPALYRALLAASKGVAQDAISKNAHEFPKDRGWLLRPLEAPNGFAQRAARYLLDLLSYAVYA